MTNRHPKRSALQVAFSDPGDVVDIDDATEAYGDRDDLPYPEIDTPCDESPSGQCEYDARHDPERCIHCGRVT